MNPDINKFIQTIKINATISKDTKDKGVEWFEIAKDDYNMSRLLYDNGHHAGAIYHLQQCLEKLAKSFFILMGSTDPDAVYGHSFTIEKMNNMFVEEWAKSAIGLMSFLKANKIVINTKSLDTLKKGQDDVRGLTKEQLKAVIGVIDKIEEILSQKRIIKKVFKETRQRKTLRRLRYMIKQVIRFRISFKHVREYITEDVIKSQIASLMLSLRVMYYSMISLPHFSTPRYPYGKGSNYWFSDYKPSLGIVDIYPDLIDRIGKLLEDYEDAEIKEAVPE